MANCFLLRPVVPLGRGAVAPLKVTPHKSAILPRFIALSEKEKR